MRTDSFRKSGHDGEDRTEEVILFGRYCIGPRTRRFLVDGIPAEIGHRAFDLLLSLIESRGTVVSKADMIARVWSDAFVDDSNLRAQIASLRRALGSDRDLVKTIPGQGHVFVGDVSTITVRLGEVPAAGSLPSPRPDGIVAAADGPAKPERNAKTNLPRLRNALIGRAVESAQLEKAIGRFRLVTLVGSGGVGKTHLVKELGWEILPGFADGIWLVDLAPLTEQHAVATATAAVLGAQVNDADKVVDAIVAVIGAQRRLVIFDNCEHLVQATADLVGTLLARVPGLSVLATSQKPLRLAGEHLFRLNPFFMPAPGPAAGGCAATSLFIERARSADRRITIDETNLGKVLEICRCLDGIPLAIEMAAARLPLLGLDGLNAGLGARLKLLKATPGMGDARHRTLRAMAEWSHTLLEDDERHVFRRVAVFPGGFALDAAMAVANEPGGDYWEAVDAFGRLVEKSLVTVENVEPPRYRLLETLRLYAREQLAASGEDQPITAAHAAHFAEFLSSSVELADKIPHADWLAIYAPEIDNFRVALDWALSADTALAVKLAGSAVRLWRRLGRVAEIRHYIERALPLVEPATPLRDAALLYMQAASLWVESDGDRALVFMEKAMALYRELGAMENLATLLALSASSYTRAGRIDDARLRMDEALEILAAHEDKASLCTVLVSAGRLALQGGETGRARHYLERGLDVAKELNDDVRLNIALRALAEVEFADGFIDRAIAMGRELVARLRPQGIHFSLGNSVFNLAQYLAVGGELAEARQMAEEALAMARDQGGFLARLCLQLWALLAVRSGQTTEAACLLGFVDAGMQRHGETLEPAEQRVYNRLSVLLTTALPPARIQAHAAEGALWSDEQALDFVLSRVIPR